MTESILYRQIREYLDRGPVPLHMPGHKRNLKSAAGLPYDFDLTEVEGTDDLHRPEGILKEAMDRTAALFGAGETYFLVN
ncbi:MAG: aminotransferase class I/II-fold pyridoxal phosphate-dependent enzyme, partial [bacterium]